MGIYEIILALIQEPLEAREKPGEDPPRTVRSTGLQETWACKNKFFLFKITQSLMLCYDRPWNCLPCALWSAGAPLLRAGLPLHVHLFFH